MRMTLRTQHLQKNVRNVSQADASHLEGGAAELAGRAELNRIKREEEEMDAEFWEDQYRTELAELLRELPERLDIQLQPVPECAGCVVPRVSVHPTKPDFCRRRVRQCLVALAARLAQRAGH